MGAGSGVGARETTTRSIGRWTAWTGTRTRNAREALRGQRWVCESRVCCCAESAQEVVLIVPQRGATVDVSLSCCSYAYFLSLLSTYYCIVRLTHALPFCLTLSICVSLLYNMYSCQLSSASRPFLCSVVCFFLSTLLVYKSFFEPS